MQTTQAYYDECAGTSWDADLLGPVPLERRSGGL